jgi:hypothetical protein
VLDEMPPADRAVAGSLWWALTGDRRLAGSAHPAAGFPFAQLHAEHGIDAIVALHGRPRYDPTPLRVAAHFALEDLYGRRSPTDPAGELAAVAAAATAVRALLDEGTGVLVHCIGGTGRTGTVIGAVLVSLGRSPDEVAAWLHDVHTRRGARGWPESPWQRTALTALACGSPAGPEG